MHRSASADNVNAPVLYYVPVSGNPSIQKNVKKHKAGLSSELESIVFYVPVNSLGASNANAALSPIAIKPIAGTNSAVIVSNSSKSLKGASSSSAETISGATRPIYVTSAGSPVVIHGNTNQVHVTSTPSFKVSLKTSPVSNKNLLTTSPIATAVSSAASPITTTISLTRSSIVTAVSSTGTPIATAVSSTGTLIATAVSSASPVTTAVSSIKNLGSMATSCVSPTTNLFPSSSKVSASFVEQSTSSTAQIAPKKQVKRPAETTVTTLVFFYLETTGLAHEIGKSNVQITEISMIAISRKEFQNSTNIELKDIRIIQKICLCTRPRTRVSSGAARVTGLNDYNLIDQQPFDQNAAAVITTFLTHLPKPVCLLAHNGALYDFPLLKAEFNRLSIQLPSDILIADTLKAFRALGVTVFPPERVIAKSVKYGSTGQISYALANLHLYFFNKNPTGSHSSEGDCIALAKVCHEMKDLMLPWIDENCYTMDTVTPMW